MRISDMIPESELLSHGIADLDVGTPCRDSRRLQKGDLFFCMDGTHDSGFSHLSEAIWNGAAAIVTAPDGISRIGEIGIPVIEVSNVRRAYARAWSRFCGSPEKSLRLIAVTGTNGKTSVSYFISELLRLAGYATGLIGTVEYSDGTHKMTSDYTTPPPETLYPLLAEMKRTGDTFAVMEASSHAISQERLYGLIFETAVFTNLSRDHLDYHGTWEAYRDAKAALFRSCKNALINLDDAAAHDMGFAAAGNVFYYAGKNKDADFQIENPLCTPDGIRYTLRCETDPAEPEMISVSAPLVGGFHIYNSAAAIACAYLAGIPAGALEEAAKALSAPCGRLEKLDIGTDFSVFIDYAHTPDALEKALMTLRPLTKKLTVLFGAGGDRDRGKRPEMGRVAAQLADLAIVTSDNPRSEEPDAIIDDIVAGMKGAPLIRITDRKAAIEYAVTHAEAGEIILLAGKGHETYLWDKEGKHTFSEREIVYQIRKGKGKENVSQHE